MADMPWNQLALDPVHDTQANFRVLLQAVSRPGRVLHLPVPAEGAPLHPWLAAMLLTLLDAETSMAADPHAVWEPLMHFVCQRTAARSAPIESADFVVAQADDADAALVRRLPSGSLEYPESGATLLLAVGELGADAKNGTRLRLEGPGAWPAVEMSVAGVSEAFFAARAEIVRNYPRGFDAFLVSDGGRVSGIPRSTRVEVMPHEQD